MIVSVKVYALYRNKKLQVNNTCSKTELQVTSRYVKGSIIKTSNAGLCSRFEKITRIAPLQKVETTIGTALLKTSLKDTNLMRINHPESQSFHLHVSARIASQFDLGMWSPDQSVRG